MAPKTPVQPLQLQPSWTLTEGIGAPAGAIYDPVTREIYISQISGEGDKKDGDGLISRVDVHGNVRKIGWVSGLNAPKGLALDDRTLWVSDIDEIVDVDVSAGKVRRRIPIPGARFLTGVAVDAKGVVYVGDMLTSCVYRIDRDRVARPHSRESTRIPRGHVVHRRTALDRRMGIHDGLFHPNSGFDLFS